LTFEKPFTLDDSLVDNNIKSPMWDYITQKAKGLLEYHSRI